nr:MAG TPA: glycoprotein [Caudoviricetes sp.]
MIRSCSSSVSLEKSSAARRTFRHSCPSARCSFCMA